MADGSTDWRTEAGLAEETTSARIYPSKVQKRRWKEESGGKSLSRYIIEHVEEARYHRQKDTPEETADGSEKEQLKKRIEELENQLEKAGNQGTPEEKDIYSPDIVKQALTAEPRTQSEVLQALLENPSFQQLVADRVEKTLYSLAQKEEVEFSRNPTGWKLAGGGEP